jgi:hypothetical protein
LITYRARLARLWAKIRFTVQRISKIFATHFAIRQRSVNQRAAMTQVGAIRIAIAISRTSVA